MEREPLVDDFEIEKIVEFLKKHNRFHAAALIQQIHDRKKAEKVDD